MKVDDIIEIGIDAKERFYIKPRKEKFPYIYREAMEVQWDEQGNILYSSKPREWTYFQWYIQILSAAKEQSTLLRLTNKTIWININDNLKKEISSFVLEELK